MREGRREGGKRNDPVGFFMGMVCVWVGRVSAYHLVECACLDESDGVCGMLISPAQEIKRGKRCLSNNLSVCLAVMFLYTSNNL